MQNVVETADLSNSLAGREKDFESLILPLAERGYRLACAMLHDPQAAQTEVAAVVGGSLGAVRARLYRAVRRLRPDIVIEEAIT